LEVDLVVANELQNVRFSGNVIAEDVSLEDYMAWYAAHHCEWVEGRVIQMAASTLQHFNIIQYLGRLFDAYFEMGSIGKYVGHSFVLRLPEFPNRRREPDLMVILGENITNLKDTYMDGPPDICIEVVSEESTARDHGEKFEEYERGGVPEYWIIDPLREECRFYRLNDNGKYRRQPETDGNYQTASLPKLILHVPTLWKNELPGPAATAQAVAQMLS
jgi:Uma2 family endonuclease